MADDYYIVLTYRTGHASPVFAFKLFNRLKVNWLGFVRLPAQSPHLSLSSEKPTKLFGNLVADVGLLDCIDIVTTC